MKENKFILRTKGGCVCRTESETGRDFLSWSRPFSDSVGRGFIDLIHLQRYPMLALPSIQSHSNQLYEYIRGN